MLKLVGHTNTDFFDNPTGRLIFDNIPVENYESIFDFGCGCGRIARQLIQQRERPRYYMGIDIHRGMIDWCRKNLTAHAPEFAFLHQDVFNPGLNPGEGKPLTSAFPVDSQKFSLSVAWSVFTHLLEPQVDFYLSEVARILRADGLFLSTWFLFDKKYFPMMQEFQNALFINTIDPTNATIFDYNWLRSAAREKGLKIVHITPPQLRGFQWTLHMAHMGNPLAEVDFPEDVAPFGIARPPLHA
jgi:SAM-dependent methyltransferase